MHRDYVIAALDAMAKEKSRSQDEVTTLRWAAEYIHADRREAFEEAAKMAEKVGNFGDYKREELTGDYGKPRFDIMNAIAAAIREKAKQP